MNESDIDVFGSIHITTLSNIQKCLGEGSIWIINSVIIQIIILIFQSTIP